MLDKNHLSIAEHQYLDLLITLILDYEKKKDEGLIPDIFGIDLVLELALDTNKSFFEIVKIFENLNDFKEVISGERNLNWYEMVQAGKLFIISPKCFLPNY